MTWVGTTQARMPERDNCVRRCHLCTTPLSRYNPDPYCAGCARLGPPRNVPTPQVADHVWGQADVQEALAARDFGRLCHLVRARSSLRQDDMAELTGLSQAFLSMLESGVRRLTNIDRIVTLIEGLGVPIELTGPMLRGSVEPGIFRQTGANSQRSQGIKSSIGLKETLYVDSGRNPT